MSVGGQGVKFYSLLIIVCSRCAGTNQCWVWEGIFSCWVHSNRYIMSFNKSVGWHIYGVTRIFPYDFYLVLAFKRYVYKFDSNMTIDSWVIAFCVKQLLLLKKKMEKREFRVLIKHCFLMKKKIQWKPNNGLITIIRTLLHRDKW